MSKYNNWPNLRLTYVVNTGETDHWGLPVVTTVSYDQVCQRSLLSLQNAQRLCAICAAEAFPDAASIECVDVQWLGKPVSSRYEDELVSNRQLDFPF